MTEEEMVLILEDNADDRELMGDQMRRLGYSDDQMVFCEHTRKAEQRASFLGHTVKLVFLDYHISYKGKSDTGLRILSAIKKASPNAEVYFHTSVAPGDSIYASLMASAADGVIDKQDNDKFRAVLRKHSPRTQSLP